MLKKYPYKDKWERISAKKKYFLGLVIIVLVVNATMKKSLQGNQLTSEEVQGIDTPAVSAATMRFAAIGDYGINNSHEAAVATLVKSWGPEFIITAGDNNYPSGAASTIDGNVGKYYHSYIQPYTGSYGSGASVNKFFPCLGNHDWMTASAAPYKQYFTLPGNERYYDFVKGNVHFFIIDSDPHESDGNTSSSVQGTWLKNKLAASTSKWDIVYFHHSPYASDVTHGSQVFMQWPFKSWGADAVISGHSHVYERIVRDNFPYFVNGLGGQSIYAFKSTPVSGSQKRYNANFGAMQITVTGDTITFRFYNINKTLIDTYRIVKPGTTQPCEAKITPGSSTTFCSGGSVVLHANTGSGLSYQWIKNGSFIVGATAKDYTATTAGDYQVRVSFSGCTKWSALTKVTVNTSLVAKITAGGPTTFCSGGSVTLYANTCSGYSYQWKKDGAYISGATSSVFVAKATGSYQIKITQGSSAAWSALMNVTVNNCLQGDTSIFAETDPGNIVDTITGIGENVPGNSRNILGLKVYPNPTSGLFNFDYDVQAVPEATPIIRVLNTAGQLVYSKRLSNGERSVELESTAGSGIYILQIQIGGKVASTKFIVKR